MLQDRGHTVWPNALRAARIRYILMVLNYLLGPLLVTLSLWYFSVYTVSLSCSCVCVCTYKHNDIFTAIKYNFQNAFSRKLMWRLRVWHEETRYLSHEELCTQWQEVWCLTSFKAELVKLLSSLLAQVPSIILYHLQGYILKIHPAKRVIEAFAFYYDLCSL